MWLMSLAGVLARPMMHILGDSTLGTALIFVFFVFSVIVIYLAMRMERLPEYQYEDPGQSKPGGSANVVPALPAGRDRVQIKTAPQEVV